MAKQIIFRRSTKSQALVNFVTSQLLEKKCLLGNATFSVETEGDSNLIIISSKKSSGKNETFLVAFVAGLVTAYCALTGESSYD